MTSLEVGWTGASRNDSPPDLTHNLKPVSAPDKAANRAGDEGRGDDESTRSGTARLDSTRGAATGLMGPTNDDSVLRTSAVKPKRTPDAVTGKDSPLLAVGSAGMPPPATPRFAPVVTSCRGFFFTYGGDLKPTESDLIAAYEYLYSVKPFSGWNLPPSKAVTFEVNKSQQLQGEYDTDPHTIRVSSYFCKTQNDVIETVAHEMVHLHMERAGQFSHANHGRDFRAHARKVCAQFGWKVKDF